MLFRKHILSTRTLLQLTVGFLFSMVALGAALAANSGVTPLLVPYTVQTIAGTPQFAGTTTAVAVGYFGEGVPATTSLAHPTGAAVLNGPYAIAVDSVGNVYITDTANFIIREVNAQTGLISTIAGVIPKGCTGSTCTVRVSGCADGVAAAGAPIGAKNEGIAVDAYGNVYFADATTATVSVIYRGGTQVANFISLVNPGGVANSGGSPQPGYVYHIAGAINLTPTSCSGSRGNVDNGLAFTNTANGSAPTATLGSPRTFFVTLDSAGNIYIGDSGNATVRVINTQATAQTFFQYTVQPGYMRSITNCNAALTVPCPTFPTTTVLNTGINGPANALVYNSQNVGAEADAYGNVYQLNGTGGGTGPPGIYAATAYAGGAPLTNLLTAEAPFLAGTYGPNSATPGNAPAELPLTYGNSYMTIDNPTVSSGLNLPVDIIPVLSGSLDIRPSSFLPDNFGTFWFMDNHYPELDRIDQYSSLATLILANKRATANIAPLNNSPASFTNPYYCVYGSTSSKIAFTKGPQTYDPQGDGCPAVVAYFTGGNFQTVSDGLANIYVGDPGEQLERELTNGNIFPATAVGTAAPITQAIQVHFNSNNPPAIGPSIPDGAATGNTTTAFSIAPGIADFTIDITTPEFPLGSLIGGGGYANTTTTPNFQLWPGLPTCTQFGAYPNPTPVIDYDCLVYVKFDPKAPGVRQSQLVVTTANGSIYNFALYGIGTGGQLAIDGGAATPVAASGLGTTAGIAVSQSGTLYIADPSKDRIVVEPAGGGAQTNLTFTGVTPATLSGPMGVAVDSANNIYVSDTGNSRVIEINPVTSVATVLGNYVWIPGNASTAPPQYAFKNPQGLAVDKWNNVYVADTGNSAVVEITSNIALGGAVPLLNYPGAPKFSNPVGVAVDSQGNIYVADTKNPTSQIVVLPPGGGDLATIPNSQFPNLVGSGLRSPGGVAVDAAGNLYVTDISNNNVVEIPSASGPGSAPFVLNFQNLSIPGGVALDAGGNLYVADTGNKQVLFDNRQNPMVNFGTVPQNSASPAQPLCANTSLADGFNVGTSGAGCPLTVTNIGNQPVTLASPITAVSGAVNAAFALSNTCTSPLPSGLTCTILATFSPGSNNGQTETVKVNGPSQTLALTANGAQPEANVVLSAAYSTGTTPTTGATATITATVTQPHIVGNTPSGTVTFTYTIDASNKNANSCGTGGTQTVALNGTGTAAFQLPVLAQGVQYTISANYNGDTLNSATPAATPLVVQVPGIPVTATVTSTAAQLTFIYGGATPVITGTVTPTPASPVTYSFGSSATATTPIGTYPVTVSFSGAGACAYGFPASVFSSGGPALVTEKPAPLTYAIPDFTAQYGAPNISYGAKAVVTGAVNGDGFGATFTNSQSSLLDVKTYSIVPTVLGANVGNYTVTAAPSTLTVTQAPTAISTSLTVTQVLATSATFTATTTNGSTSVTAVSSTAGLLVGELVSGDTIASGTKISAIGTGTITLSTSATGSATGTTIAAGVAAAGVSISVNTTVSRGKGVPQGSVTVTDNFTPITATGYGQPAAPTTAVIPLTAGVGTFRPNQTTPGSPAGIHQYSFSYSGDSNFQSSQVVPVATAPACIPSSVASNCLIVDFPDFTLTSNTGPVVVIPGIVPSGNGLLPAPNQSTAAPETAVLFVNAVLGFTGSVNLSCQTQNPSYVSCFMTPTTVCFATTSTLACTNTSSTAATVVAIQTPATLPLGFFNTGQTRTSVGKTVLAFLPFGVLAFCVRRRRRLSKALWMMIAFAAVGAGMSGCGGNQVNFYTPIPTGPQTVTVTASYLGNGGTQPAATRQFVVPIAID